jgi:hypothetical protein
MVRPFALLDLFVESMVTSHGGATLARSSAAGSANHGMEADF